MTNTNKPRTSISGIEVNPDGRGAGRNDRRFYPDHLLDNLNTGFDSYDMKLRPHDKMPSLLPTNQSEDIGETGILAALEHGSPTRSDGRRTFPSMGASAKTAFVSTLLLTGASCVFLIMRGSLLARETTADLAVQQSAQGRHPTTEKNVVTRIAAQRPPETAAHIETVASAEIAPKPMPNSALAREHGVTRGSDALNRGLENTAAHWPRVSENLLAPPGGGKLEGSVRVKIIEKPAATLDTGAKDRTDRQSTTNRQNSPGGGASKLRHDADEEVLAALLTRVTSEGTR